MRVYAIKCLIMGVAGESICAHMGYLELDLYGKTDMVRPNQPAVEEFTVEHLLELGIFYYGFNYFYSFLCFHLF